MQAIQNDCKNRHFNNIECNRIKTESNCGNRNEFVGAPRIIELWLLLLMPINTPGFYCGKWLLQLKTFTDKMTRKYEAILKNISIEKLLRMLLVCAICLVDGFPWLELQTESTVNARGEKTEF
jgi:hypothetical protein